MKKNTETSEHK